ncbi:Ergothioneine biosynthesis protein 1 like [Verticillium longisporum]|nr:Ergothioneine biosynthesis protein 1 like [Verticillium longisporum]
MPATTSPEHDQALGCKAAQKAASQLDIIDVRRAAVEVNLKDDILSMWNPKDGPRKLPTLLLYNEKGLQLFEDITYLEEYYLTNNEIEALTQYSKQIAEMIPSDAMVIELGSGNLRKVCLLLQAFENAGKNIDYYALDLFREELERTLGQVPAFQHVKCHGLWGTYDDGREWLKSPSLASRSKCILSLGSSIGNFDQADAADFLRSFGDILQPSDTMLIGLDGCEDAAKVYHGYNDQEGVTHQFLMNGLANANEILGEEAFKPDDWRADGEYIFDDQGRRHQAFYYPVRETTALGAVVRPHERVQIEQSLKYSPHEAKKLWHSAGMAEIARWQAKEHGLHLLIKPRMPFSLAPSVYAATPLPTLDQWSTLWSAWDIVTRGMLPNEELHDKPIKLRNACIFYLGHIPTFLDIQLNKTTRQQPTEPAYYISIFERGIDPDVDNPEHCHAHSEVPDEWPAISEIVDYQQRVRSRLRGLYSHGEAHIPRDVARAIWIGFEHEVMHMETLLYMMLQSDKTQPPPHTETPNFKSMAEEAQQARVANEWHGVPAQSVIIGMDDDEKALDNKGYFGWDNEKPSRRVNVHSFEAKGRAITNEEYAKYLHECHIEKLPASWVSTQPASPTTNGNGVTNGNTNGHANGHTNGCANGHVNSHPGSETSLPTSYVDGIAVRTVYGPVPLSQALDWPVAASYDEIAGCAAYMGGRIPTFEETKSIYAYVNRLKRREAENKLGKTVPAVNGHLSNNGVQETPPSASPSAVDEVSASDLFVDLEGTNVGFQHWHPTPVTAGGGRLAGQAEFGGLWEWTSSPLRKHEGFEPMELYPAYTADFFDDKHNIILGGSWATHPRIAGRSSFVNWYQRNYLYAWAGARLVRDVQTNGNAA